MYNVERRVSRMASRNAEQGNFKKQNMPEGSLASCLGPRMAAVFTVSDRPDQPANMVSRHITPPFYVYFKERFGIKI